MAGREYYIIWCMVWYGMVWYGSALISLLLSFGPFFPRPHSDIHTVRIIAYHRLGIRISLNCSGLFLKTRGKTLPFFAQPPDHDDHDPHTCILRRFCVLSQVNQA